MTAPDPITAEERAERWADLFGAAPDMTAQAMFGDDHPTVLLARAEAAEKREADLRQRIEALVNDEVADVIEANVCSEVADARCLDCNLRYGERQEYGCHESGLGHSYADEAIAAAEREARADPVEYVTLPVASLRALLVAPEAGEEGQG